MSQQRVWILRTMWYFSFSFLINLQKCQQFCVFLSIWGAVCTLMRKKNELKWFLANGCNITKSEKFKGVWILSVPTVYIYIYTHSAAPLMCVTHTHKHKRKAKIIFWMMKCLFQVISVFELYTRDPGPQKQSSKSLGYICSNSQK